MVILNQVDLSAYNSFGIKAIAHQMIKIQSENDLISLKNTELSYTFILGGGSNVLLKNAQMDRVLNIDIGGIEIIKEEEGYVLVEVGAGVIWHDLVLWAIDQNLGGIENLSLIPGKVGAAPIQNIGAYGVELKDVFHSLSAFHLIKKQIISLHATECKFGYRDSIFKNELKGKLIITKLVLQLTKQGFHQIETSYGAIQLKLQEKGIEEPKIRDVSNAVIEIRKSKLPDPAVIGNAGSFFKNPIIPEAILDTLRRDYPNIPNYPSGVSGHLKLAAGWLIDQCGWKGKVMGNTGCYKNQALVIVNHGNSTGQEIYDFSSQIIKSVFEQFGVQLEREVNVID